jgi:hypothetical protein
MMPLARASVAEDRVVVGFLPVALQRTSPTQILEQIEAELPARLVQERTQLVVCHGDLCLANILVDPDTVRSRRWSTWVAWEQPTRTATSHCFSPPRVRRGPTSRWLAGPKSPPRANAAAEERGNHAR